MATLGAVASIFTIAAGATGIAATAASVFQPQGWSEKEIYHEQVRDYENAIADIKAQTLEAQGEAKRRIGAAKEEGVLSLKEQGAQSAYEAGLANKQAEMIVSSVESKLAASGVRQAGSPLLAAQQQADLAYGAAERTTEAGRAAMTLGGIKLKTGLADITAAGTLATAEFNRKQYTLERKLREIKRIGSP